MLTKMVNGKKTECKELPATTRENVKGYFVKRGIIM